MTLVNAAIAFLTRSNIFPTWDYYLVKRLCVYSARDLARDKSFKSNNNGLASPEMQTQNQKKRVLQGTGPAGHSNTFCGGLPKKKL